MRYHTSVNDQDNLEYFLHYFKVRRSAMILQHIIITLVITLLALALGSFDPSPLNWDKVFSLYIIPISLSFFVYLKVLPRYSRFFRHKMYEVFEITRDMSFTLEITATHLTVKSCENIVFEFVYPNFIPTHESNKAQQWIGMIGCAVETDCGVFFSFKYQNFMIAGPLFFIDKAQADPEEYRSLIAMLPSCFGEKYYNKRTQ